MARRSWWAVPMVCILGLPLFFLQARNNTPERLLSDNRRCSEQPNSPRDLFWVHVPKTGTSFAITILRHTCPPPAAALPGLLAQVPRIVAANRAPDAALGLLFLRLFAPHCSPHALQTMAAAGFALPGGQPHAPLPSSLRQSRLGVIMLRTPARRLRAAWGHHIRAGRLQVPACLSPLSCWTHLVALMFSRHCVRSKACIHC